MPSIETDDFQFFFNNAPGLYLVLSPDLKIVAMTDVYLKTTLKKRDEVIGKHLFDVFPDNPDNLDANGERALKASLDFVLQNKSTHTMPEIRYDVQDADGKYETKYWRPINTPIFDDNNEIRLIFVKTDDVTEEMKLHEERIQEAKQHEEELRDINKNLEEQVKAKTVQLTAMFERITDGFIALDKDFNYLYVNEKIGTMLNRNPEELIGKNVWEVFPDVVNSPTYNAFTQAMATQQYVSNTDHYEPLNLWQENHIYPSPDGLSIFIRDISYRMKSENELKASEQKYRFLFDNNPLPMWMLSLPERQFLAVNNSAVEHYGYSHEEFLSMNASDIRPADEVDKFNDSLKILRPGIYNAGVWRHLKKDGSIISVEILAHNTMFDGKAARLIAANDVTERLRTEQALRQSEEVNRLIMSSSLNAIVCMDLDGKIIFWNRQAEKIFGWEKEEVIGRMLGETILPVEFRDRQRASLQKYLDTGTSNLLNKLLEMTAINKDGDEFYIELAIVPVRENGNEFLCCFVQDITERKKSEEQLKQSHEQLRQLASHLQDVREEEQKRIAREVHDELGQQITGLKMDVAWIWKKIAATKVDISIEEKLKEMTSLLDSAVKTIRKIASELRPSILDDMGLVAALEWQSVEFQKRFQIPIEFTSSSQMPEVDSAIATGLFRLFQESLTNVARHSRATMVSAKLDMDEEKITLSIADNGKGFDTEQSGGRKTLGLLGMKERTLMMNGRLNFISAPGKGTTVSIVVPLPQKELVTEKALQNK